MGLTCILFSWLTKMPVVTAWSTPGAAFLLTSVDAYTLPEAIGAFMLCAVFSLITAQSRVLLSLISRIPAAISSALLAGILLPICLAIFADVKTSPILVASYLVVYLVGSRWFAQYLMLVLLILSIALSMAMQQDVNLHIALPTAVWVTPTFSLTATLGLAFPLFIITTLSQNLPGIAIHHAHGYQPDHKPILSGIAIVQALLAPFGGFTFNLAAITAALCMGEHADIDKTQRYRAAIAAGFGYLIMAGIASIVVALFVSMPAVIVHLLAGLALLATLQGAISRSMEVNHHRAPAILTLLCTTSGFTLFSLTSAVWGLALGLLLLLFQKKDNDGR